MAYAGRRPSVFVFKSVISGLPERLASVSDHLFRAALAAATSSGVEPVEKASASMKSVVCGVALLATQPTISAAAMMRRRASGLPEGSIS